MVRPSAERGSFELPWLRARYTFSFNRYFDPRHMQFRSMRVLNEDVIAPGQGFGMHGHDNMEILTWVLSGSLAHRDTTGGEGTIGPGELQHMTAGSGVEHSEFNASASDPVHLFQIWIFPDERDLTPGYEQRAFSADGRRNRLQRIASKTGADGALTIHQDAEVFALDLAAGAQVEHATRASRGVWIQLASGAVDVNGTALQAGDGVALTGAETVLMGARTDAHLLLFDLA